MSDKPSGSGYGRVDCRPMVRPDPTGFSEPVLESSAQVRVGVFSPRPLVRSLPGFSFSGTLESASRICGPGLRPSTANADNHCQTPATIDERLYCDSIGGSGVLRLPVCVFLPHCSLFFPTPEGTGQFFAPCLLDNTHQAQW